MDKTGQKSIEEERGNIMPPPVKTRLKWFNGPKGFGFVVPEDDENTDAFLHITTLQDAGIDALGDDAHLLCHIDQTPRGATVTGIVELLDIGILPQTMPPKHQKDEQDGGNNNVKINGAVKWYKPDRGFGFVTPDDGEKDVFIHKSCLNRHGIEMLETGQRLFMKVKIVPKGREVLDFDFLTENKE